MSRRSQTHARQAARNTQVPAIPLADSRLTGLDGVVIDEFDQASDSGTESTHAPPLWDDSPDEPEAQRLLGRSEITGILSLTAAQRSAAIPQIKKHFRLALRQPEQAETTGILLARRRRPSHKVGLSATQDLWVTRIEELGQGLRDTLNRQWLQSHLARVIEGHPLPIVRATAQLLILAIGGTELNDRLDLAEWISAAVEGDGLSRDVRASLVNLQQGLLEALGDPSVPLARPDDASIKPHWDQDRRELSLNGVVLKKFKKTAPFCEQILNRFQRRKWQGHIRFNDKEMCKERLAATVRTLNDSLKKTIPGMRIVRRGDGSSLCWELTSELGAVNNPQ